MKEVTLVEFRRNAEGILKRLGRGERLLLTRRGRPVARLEPVSGPTPGPGDPIYSLADLAQDGAPLSNQDMDQNVYGI